MRHVSKPNMQNTNTIKTCIFQNCVFCMCNFLSITTIFYTLTTNTKALHDYKIFNRASLLMTFESLSFNPVFESSWVFNTFR